jgi:iron complex outermembrane receptor protein
MKESCSVKPALPPFRFVPPVSLLLLVAAFGPTRAQTAGETPPASALGDTAVMVVPEVVVTGRTGEPLGKAPAAITIVPRSRFIDKPGLSLKDGLTLVPGVLAQSRAGAQDTRVLIRGFGARGSGERSNSGVMRGIRVMTDGIPLSEPDGRTAFDLADLAGVDRMEVQRSNASALYGNASGGVIDLQSQLQFDRPFLTLRSRGGSFGLFKQQVQFGSVIDRSRLTTSISGTTFDGWREHSGTQAFLLQSRLATPLNDRTKMNVLLDVTADEFHYPGALTPAEADSAPEQANPQYVTRNERRQNQVGRLAMKVEHQVNDDHAFTATLFAEPKVLHRSERNRFRDFNRYHVGGSFLWRGAVIRSESATGHLSAGADEAWQDGSILFYNLTPEGNRGTTNVANQREGANSAGAFVQGELVADQVWQVRGSIRYDSVWYLSENRMEPELNDDKSFTHWTPRVSLGRILGRQNLYASVAGGLESPAFNEIDPQAPYDTLTSLNPFLDPTYSTTYEVGLRGRLSDGLNYDVAGYWIDVKNDLVALDGGVYWSTAGKSRRKGVEGSIEWRPSERLTVSAMGTVSDNKYVEYANERGDFAGKRVAALPDWFGTGQVEFRITPQFKLHGGVESVGHLFADDANTQEADGWAIGNLGADWTTLLGKTSVHVFALVQNVADARYTASVFINGVDDRFVEPGVERNVTAGLTLGW